MESQIVESQINHRPHGTSLLLDLPRELLAKICRFIISTDRLYILLLALEGEAEEESTRDRGFFFDRGYGFPVFQTSFLTVCSPIYEVCMSLWLKTSQFRL